MNIAIVFAFTFIISTNLFSAGPVTHTYIAERWIAKAHPTWTQDQKRSFIIGTLFPDIRYPAHVPRELTHEKNVTLAKIEKTSSLFEQGKKFHAYVDVFRENTIKGTGIYHAVRQFLKKKHLKKDEINFQLICSFLKFVEDVDLYPRQTWGQIEWDLEHMEPEEKNYGIPEDKVKAWHSYLCDCLKTGPIETLRKHNFFKKTLTIPGPLLEKWGQIIPEFCKTKQLKKHIKMLVSAFDKEFDKFLSKKPKPQSK